MDALDQELYKRQMVLTIVLAAGLASFMSCFSGVCVCVCVCVWCVVLFLISFKVYSAYKESL